MDGRHFDKCSAVAEMGDRLAITDIGRKEGAAVFYRVEKKGAAVPLSGGGAGSSSNTVWPGPRSTSVATAILIHPPLGYNRRGPKMGDCAPFGEGSWLPI